MKRTFFGIACLSFAVVLVLAVFPDAEGQGRMRRKMPSYEYGTIILDRYTEAKKMAPAVFRHWVHRSKHTCRVCHIDIGFAMEAGATDITEADNRAGLYCGACHNGKDAFGCEEKGIVGKEKKNCDRCHSETPIGMDPHIRTKFNELAAKLPRGRFGDGIDWTKAEADGLIKPKDFIEGISFPRPKMKHDQGEISIDAKLSGLQDIIFSHKKHAVWNGCELCHPDIFAVKAGTTKFAMTDNFQGRFCGACHGKVAFPNRDCGLCHAKKMN